MAVKSTRVSVGTSVTPIASIPSTDEVPNARAGRFLLINNTATASVFLGDDQVTTGAGDHAGVEWKITLPPIGIDLEPGETLYGRVASGTQEVHVLQAGRP